MSTQFKISVWSVLIAGLVATVFGLFSYYSFKTISAQSATDSLAQIRDVKARQVEDYFSARSKTMAALSKDAQLSEAVTAFKSAYERVGRREDVLPDNISSILRQHYERYVLPGIQKKSGPMEGHFDKFWPKRNAAQYLQYQYVIDQGSTAPLQTNYQITHKRYHADLTLMRETIGGTDLLLIDHLTGNIIYSTEMGIDLGMNIYAGPYRSEALVPVVDTILAQPVFRSVHISDLTPYLPDENAHSLFMAVPIVEGGIIQGILAARWSGHQFTDIVSSGGQWDRFGLGKTGEIYLAGDDFFMRTNSRFADQDIENYVNGLTSRGVQQTAIDKVSIQRSTALVQEVKTNDVILAARLNKGLVLTRDYRGKKVFSAYAPLSIPGQNWVIITKQDYAEVLGSLKNHMRTLVGLGLALMIVTWLLSRLVGRIMTRSTETPHKTRRSKSTSRAERAMHDEETS